jgi:predicted dehydrogenase
VPGGGSPFGVGVIGLGDWGLRHLHAWSSIPGIAIRAVASRDPDRARVVAERFGAPNWYLSPGELVADRTVDAVCVVNDEHEHLGAVLAAIDAGKSVLVEKPMAVDLADARAMVEASKRRGVILMPGHVLRFDHRFAALKDRIDAGDLGRPVAVHARRMLPVDRFATYQRTHVMLNVGVHDLDLALWYLGGEVERVTAVERRVQGGATPDLVWAVLELAGGALAVVAVLWLLPTRSGVFVESLTEVTGTRGMATVRQPGDGLSLWLRDGPVAPDTTLAPVIAGDLTGALRDELQEFARCVIAGRSPTRVTPEDGLRALEVAHRVVAAAAAGAPA